MARFKAFLESSTIHGLTYISSTKRYARLFWIFVVIAGFTGAIFLIYESFKSWANDPVKTYVETLPISKIKFPKVTVCPPKNTYTDLNYDLSLAENKTLTDEERDELYDYALKTIFEHTYMDGLDKVQEENRFFNWYHGYSKIHRASKESDGGLKYHVLTSATSGVVSTQYFEEQFQNNLLERKVHYWIQIYPPLSVQNDTNITLHFELEKLTIGGLKSGWDNIAVDELHILEEGLENTSIKFSPPKSYRFLRLKRNNISVEDFQNMKLKVMPGFRLRWYYTGSDKEVTPNRMALNEETELFNM